MNIDDPQSDQVLNFKLFDLMMLIIVSAHHSVDFNQADDQDLIQFSHMISVSSYSELIEQLSEKLLKHFHQ